MASKLPYLYVCVVCSCLPDRSLLSLQVQNVPLTLFVSDLVCHVCHVASFDAMSINLSGVEVH